MLSRVQKEDSKFACFVRDPPNDLIQLGSDLTPMLQFSEESTQPRPLNNKQDGH
jgi:hypothetical protein